MRIYLKDDSIYPGLKPLGYASLPEFRGGVVTLEAHTEPGEIDFEDVGAVSASFETKSFLIDRVANGFTCHDGYHKAIILSDVKDIDKYFRHMSRA